MNKKTLFITQAAIIAALYVVLTYFIAAFNLASGAIQFRISEALTILPIFTPAAIPGLFVGCLISNTITGCVVTDIIFGSLATLIGAIGTYMLRKLPYLAPLPPIIANAFIVPFVLQYAYGIGDAYWYLVLTVGAGEILSCYVLGIILYHALKGVRKIFSISGEAEVSA
jgi:uncharacterized membrane protein